MLNVYIYLDDKINAEELVQQILQQKLVANASIDVDNNYYELVDDKVEKKVHVVITAQTKGLLFKPLTDFIERNFGKQVPVFASPLVSANFFFDQFIRNATNKV